MIPQTPRHDFLHSLHELLHPATYVEIGVQTGRSLAQALPFTFCIGVDPDPQISVPIDAPYQVFPMTSDAYFGLRSDGRRDVYDLAFIDGMHLVEYCLRDFMNVESRSRPDGRTVAVFDDVLPYSADIAGRTPLPGDWAGDCWKIAPVLSENRPDLTLILVDVAPTGALVVLGLNPAKTTLHDRYADLEAAWTREIPAPEWAVTRQATEDQPYVRVVRPDEALDSIRTYLDITEADA